MDVQIEMVSGEGDVFYDTILVGKVYVPPEYDLMGEWRRIRPRVRAKMRTRNPNAMTVDEWAERFGLDSGQLLARLAEARPRKVRRKEARKLQRQLRAQYKEAA